MEKKLKVSEFAELVGITSKTVYKMESRGEITTVNERVNNRPTTLIITNDEQINHFRSVYSKAPFTNGNCNDILTENEKSMDYNNASQSANNNEIVQEMFERIILLNDEYNNRIAKLSEELVTTKAQVLLIEDKKNIAEGDKTHWQKEYFKLNEENKALNKQLSKSNKVLLIVITVSITLLITFIGVSITNNVTNTKKSEIEEVTKAQQTQVISEKSQVNKSATKRK